MVGIYYDTCHLFYLFCFFENMCHEPLGGKRCIFLGAREACFILFFRAARSRRCRWRSGSDPRPAGIISEGGFQPPFLCSVSALTAAIAWPVVNLRRFKRGQDRHGSKARKVRGLDGPRSGSPQGWRSSLGAAPRTRTRAPPRAHVRMVPMVREGGLQRRDSDGLVCTFRRLASWRTPCASRSAAHTASDSRACCSSPCPRLAL